MRDLVLLSILPFVLFAMAKRPFIGLGMWIWTAMFFPNAWVYGIAGAIRYNLLFTGVAILSYLVMKKKPKIVLGSHGALVLVFLAWTTISTIFTLAPPDVSWEIWSRFAKGIALFVFILLVVQKKLHVDFFLWCVVLSIGFYGNLEALKFIASGGGHMIEGIHGHVLGDRNELSLAFVMSLPICIYLLGQYKERSVFVKFGLLATMVLLIAAVVGTQSRGGFIALSGLGAYFFVKSERKVLVAIVGAFVIFGLSYIVTDDWTARMNTIDAAGEDASFMGRVVAWKLSFILALKNPIFGGGFKSLEYLPVWIELSKDFFSHSWFYTGDSVPSTAVARAAHSIYFQVLAEHGFGGLLIFATLIVTTFLKAGLLARKARKSGAPAWIASLATMLQLSVFAYALGGAALSFAYFELYYAIIGMLIVLERRILPSVLKDSRHSSVTQTLVHQ